jgi:cytidylate kinase
MRSQHRIPYIAIVGVCASGKTVLAEALQKLGHDARALAQEHSYAPSMWRSHGRPALLIYLDAEAEEINARLNRRDWTSALVDEQRRRLADARAQCDLYLHTDGMSEAEVLERVLAFLHAAGSGKS